MTTDGGKFSISYVCIFMKDHMEAIKYLRFKLGMFKLSLPNGEPTHIFVIMKMFSIILHQ